MAAMTMIQALNSALDVTLGRDPDVLIFGEDAGYFGGVFRVTDGLQKKYGPTRCFDAPICELGIVAAGIGMAVYGLRPVLEIQFADYIYPAYDQLVSEAAKIRWRSAGGYTVPITVRAPYGGGIFGGQTHSQSPEALFTHVAGLKTVIPSTPYDAKGLLISAIECNDPVIFLSRSGSTTAPSTGGTTRRWCPGRSIRPARCRRATTRSRSARRTWCAPAARSRCCAMGRWCMSRWRRRRKAASTRR
ncbi:MAG: hypothetical protein WDN03_08340 [Rhizomicrobium sp.]